MNFSERLLNLAKSHGVSINKLLIDLQLAKGSFGNWQARGTIPNGETLSKIAAYFNVSTDYLLGNENKKTSPPSEENEIVNEILDKFPKLSQEQQNILLQMINQFAKDKD